MIDYYYLRVIVFSLHLLLIVLSVVCAYVYIKKIALEKSPLNNSFLVVANLPELEVIAVSVLFFMLNIAFISNFFNRIPSYFYKITLLLACSIFLYLFIKTSTKGTNGIRQ